MLIGFRYHHTLRPVRPPPFVKHFFLANNVTYAACAAPSGVKMGAWLGFVKMRWQYATSRQRTMGARGKARQTKLRYNSVLHANTWFARPRPGQGKTEKK